QRLDPTVARQVESLLRRCYASRRKMLRNTLAGLLPQPDLMSLVAEAGIDLAQRPQELAPSQWVVLATGLNRCISERTGG
ncbi:MAG: 16S rRNA (adenine(1518)-N(6)/adenine(1519)-N(6))-dimethyltransferase, partial [Cyanobium sp.]